MRDSPKGLQQSAQEEIEDQIAIMPGGPAAEEICYEGEDRLLAQPHPIAAQKGRLLGQSV